MTIVAEKRINLRGASIEDVMNQILDLGWTFTLVGKDKRYKATVSGEGQEGDTLFLKSVEATLFHATVNLCNRLGVRYW